MPPKEGSHGKQTTGTLQSSEKNSVWSQVRGEVHALLENGDMRELPEVEGQTRRPRSMWEFLKRNNTNTGIPRNPNPMPMPGSEAARKDPRTMHHYEGPAVMERHKIVSTPPGPNFMDGIFTDEDHTWRQEIEGHQWVDEPDPPIHIPVGFDDSRHSSCESPDEIPPESEIFFHSLVDAGVVKL
jgi:hypothetical protein